jgi:hypothetical protein
MKKRRPDPGSNEINLDLDSVPLAPMYIRDAIVGEQQRFEP